MYTQCPECGTAFRVTAEVLKQAAGKVRCGGCSSTFNALEYLSEQKPAAPVQPAKDGSVPELKPESVELEAVDPPKTISAERSAALLKTLDELAGSDIRIEDTGVEWRVLDEGEEAGDGDVTDEGDVADGASDTGSMKWFIDESPTPVDEALSTQPGSVEAPEIFEDEEQATASAVMRFDDDTPLPDDFDFDQQSIADPEPVTPVESRDDPSELEAAQVDLALGEPEDWEDLLGEVDEPDEIEDEAEVALADELDAVQDDDDAIDDAVEPLPDVDEQFATQAEAMGIDLSGIHAQSDEPEADVGEPTGIDDTSIDEDLIAAAFEAEAAARAKEEEQAAPELDLEDELEDVLEEALGSETDGFEEDDEVELELEAFEADDEDEDVVFEIEDEDLVEARDRELVVSTEADAKLAAELGLDNKAHTEDASSAEPFVPAQTEEEKTVNMMIDQDLLAFAVEDEEGFASTIVQKQRGDEVKPVPEPEDEDDVESAADEIDEDKPSVETIIMEGEFIRDAVEEEKLEEARKKSGDPNLKSAAAAALKGLAKSDEPEPKEPINYGLVAGIAALVLLFAVQALHQSRESLATNPAFSSMIGPIYRMLGRPVTPSWDISGWRFEATKGSTDDDDEVLTIYSRVGNKSGESLPYPLISVSLTDRFEDIIGSKVLEPGDYLAENLDTRRPVAPGNTFSAIISIEAPDAEATGFKLNVCYRQPGGQLRCAIDDFK
jgi:predicted Zn finger-like uncharacterized protein